MEKLEFDKSIARLEEIARLLEQGQVPLEESLKLYEEGSKLAAYCADSLKKAELKITEMKISGEKSGEQS
ncbi:MAG: exodeoxyribonuclease VII small subunit [Oscillospiraceae bacterium]|jgi:exodeoxyribonuclease VII small subunit|nr:exodeoxyribonuclease VII small subunit [Oscillospiraceae bacterium]